MRLNRVSFTIMFLCLSIAQSIAQELEYKYEVGILGGTSFYLGDANTNIFYRNNSLAGGAMLRHNINPRMSLKYDLAIGGLKGDARESGNYFPQNINPEFNNTVWDLSCMYELGFWGYGTGKSYKGTKRFAPYIALGLGFTHCQTTTLNIPFGIGVRYKIAERWNAGLDWSMHFALSDKLDGINDPYRITSGFLKNKDSYCMTMFYISYDICPKLRKCNND